MKKVYSINLDEDKVEEVRQWLEPKGLSLSGYINSLLDEQLSAMKLYGDRNEKVTVLKFIKLAAKMVRNLNDSKKNT